MNAANATRMAWQQTVERLARFGYICKGSVYVIIGALTAATIAGRGELADSQDAFSYILAKPFGSVLLVAIAIGLLGYAVWRLTSGFTDSERRGSGAQALATRAGAMLRGLFYGGVAVELIRRVQRGAAQGEGSDAQARHWTARLLDAPLGRWLVALVGIGIIAYCGWQLAQALRGKMSKTIRTGAIPRWLFNTARFGLGARALIFGVIGGSLVSAAIGHDPQQARGTTGALRMVAEQPFGAVLLALTGLGLIGYGVYSFVNARYRQIDAT